MSRSAPVLCAWGVAVLGAAVNAGVCADDQHPAASEAGAPVGAAGSLPPYLADRGRGIATSQFGTYVEKGQWLVYSFYEYTRTGHFEYNPEELGFTGDEEHIGKLTENEGLLFVSYGVSDRLAVELEAALRASSELRRAPDDLVSGVPDRLKESGLGDVESQVRWRWAGEGERRPEMYSFLDIGYPFQRHKVILGTQDWEYALGFGVIKGHRWGTLTGRVALSYEQVDGQFDLGEYAVEYLKRVSPNWRFVAAIEGETDEVEAIVEAQARLGRHTVLKMNSGFGVTKKAADLAPEIGLLFTF